MSNYMNFNKSISPRVNPVRSSMVSLVNQSSISRNFRSATLNGYSWAHLDQSKNSLKYMIYNGDLRIFEKIHENLNDAVQFL